MKRLVEIEIKRQRGDNPDRTPNRYLQKPSLATATPDHQIRQIINREFVSTASRNSIINETLTERHTSIHLTHTVL
jgi:hypothetical protein